MILWLPVHQVASNKGLTKTHPLKITILQNNHTGSKRVFTREFNISTTEMKTLVIPLWMRSFPVRSCICGISTVYKCNMSSARNSKNQYNRSIKCKTFYYYF